MFTNVKKVMMRLSASLVVATLVFTPAYASQLNTVTLIDDGYVKTVSTEMKTVSEVLAEHAVKINPSDIVNYEKSAEIENEMTIEIKRAKEIYIPSSGKIIVTAEDFDKEFLAKYDFPVPEGEFYVKETYDASKDAIVLEIIECETKTETVTEKISNSTVYLKDDSMYANEARVETKGQGGMATRTYSVRYENGAEVSKILINEVVSEKPVDRVVYVGTKPVPRGVATPVADTLVSSTPSTLTTAGGKVLSYSKAITVTATAYDLSYESCGKNPGDRGYGITASGMKAGYGVIAVDPRVIPLGTRLYITAPDGSWTYGEAIAGDTGGAIKGNKIDLFYNTKAECMNFGRRTATVYILN